MQNELVGVEAKADKRNIYSLSAPEIQSLPSIGTAKEFDLEGCAALAPDLVIVPAKLKDSIPQMEEMGLTVLAVKPENQADLFGAIELLAQATNTTARGEELEMAIDSNLAALAEAVAGTDAPSVLPGRQQLRVGNRRLRHVSEHDDRKRQRHKCRRQRGRYLLGRSFL